MSEDYSILKVFFIDGNVETFLIEKGILPEKPTEGVLEFCKYDSNSIVCITVNNIAYYTIDDYVQ